MSDDSGLSALAVVMIVSCVALVMTTNRMYGQPTFFSPQSSSSVDEKGLCASTSGSTSRTSRERTATSTGDVFGRVPEFGVLEVILSFLSPADLVGTEAVSTTFRRSSIAEHLWMQHCVRTFSPLAQLGEAWCLQQQQEDHQHRHVQHRHKQQWEDENDDEEDEEEGWGGSGRFRHSKACYSSCCSRSSGRGGYHEGGTHAGPPLVSSTATSRSTADARRSGSCGRTGSDGPPSPSSLSRSCCDRSAYNCPWREAFFSAHRARPHLLRELSSSLASNVHQPPSHPAPEQQCIIVLHGKVYDLADFLSSHPGGALILQEHASTDATEAFERFFHSREARRMAKRFVVWDGEAVMGRKGTLWRFANRGIST